MLVLAIGDFHIPHRTLDIPAKFKKLLVPGKIQQILCTGNLCSSEVLEYLRTVSSDVLLVRGDFDDSVPPSTPTQRVIEHGSLRIGVIHGHQIIPPVDSQALSIVARKMNADVLVYGHSHKFEAYEYEGRFFVNPGSATGAFSNLPLAGSEYSTETTPSFVLMDVQETTVTMYVYQIVDGEVKVEKLDYAKRS
ncbi:Vacuolar protein sorting-associated protein 29 [Nowakowskiella sp. JEL0407]|nr:Vacuolar protein sorting-associated protein 29 [Nowakowskiella sp. JEL0407]